MYTSNIATTLSCSSKFLWLAEGVNAMADFGLHGSYNILSYCDTWAVYTASLLSFCTLQGCSNFDHNSNKKFMIEVITSNFIYSTQVNFSHNHYSCTGVSIMLTY